MEGKKRVRVNCDGDDSSSSLNSEELESVCDEEINKESNIDYSSNDDDESYETDSDIVNKDGGVNSSSAESDDAEKDNDDEVGRDKNSEDEVGEDDDDEDDDDDDDDDDSHCSDSGSAYEDMEVDVENEIEEGNGIIAQSKMYNGLLSCRMKAQEALTAMNQLPQGDDFKCLSLSGSKFEETIKDTQNIIQNTLLNLVKLQEDLLLCRNDTKFIAKVKLQSESEKMETGASCNNLKSIAQMQKSKGYCEFLSNKQKFLNKFRDQTLETVENQAAVLSVRNSFENFESSAVGQIKQVLLDKHRLIRRTQLIRSSLPIIGRKENPEVDEKSSTKLKYDCEIFDDSDFYHKLLTQHVSLKTANLTDMTAISKEWAELSNLKKNKISVDRKASKGRKLRYTVHRKLINFMTPVHLETQYSDEQRDALVREVFRGLEN